MCNFHVEHITLNCVCKKALIIHLVIIYVCRFYFILIRTCRSILSFCCWQSIKKQQSRIFRFDEVIKLQWVCFNRAIACMMSSYNRSYLHLRSLNFDYSLIVLFWNRYVRVSKGNQLVRNPKKVIRMLANEKVRWSLHTVRSRLAKKQQYCQFFTRFGECKKPGGKCRYIHDRAKVTICTKFLKGLCSDTSCKLTHKVSHFLLILLLIL
jgi:hypothetical protein